MRILYFFVLTVGIAIQIQASEIRSAKSALRFIGEGCWALPNSSHKSQCFRKSIWKLKKKNSIAELLFSTGALCDVSYMYSHRNVCIKAAIKYSNVKSWKRKFNPIEKECEAIKKNQDKYKCYKKNILDNFDKDYINAGTQLSWFFEQINQAALTLPDTYIMCVIWDDRHRTCQYNPALGQFFMNSIELYLNDMLPLTAENILEMCIYRPEENPGSYPPLEIKTDCAFLAAQNSGRPEFQNIINKCKEVDFNKALEEYPWLYKPLTKCLVKELKKL